MRSGIASDGARRIAAELTALEQETVCSSESWADVLPELRRRLVDWQAILSEQAIQARQMLRRLLAGRIVFTPRPHVQGVEFAGDNDHGQLFAGLVLPKALASPTGFGRLWYWPVHNRIELAA